MAFEDGNNSKELIVVTCWELWNNRNESVWQSRSFSVLKVNFLARNFLQQWREEQREPSSSVISEKENGMTTLKPPSAGSLKLNVDAALFNDQRKAGIGIAIRDEHGFFVAAKSIPIWGDYDPKVAEAFGVREALSWIKNRFPGVVFIEMDALIVTNAIRKSEPDNSYFGMIIEDCRSLARELHGLVFNWIRRSANRVAHVLAKVADSLPESREWSYFPPLFISDVLVSDSMNE